MYDVCTCTVNAYFCFCFFTYCSALVIKAEWSSALVSQNSRYASVVAYGLRHGWAYVPGKYGRLLGTFVRVTSAIKTGNQEQKTGKCVCGCL